MRCSTAGLRSQCSGSVRFSSVGSVSSLANADWPRQLAGASNDTQRRRVAPLLSPSACRSPTPRPPPPNVRKLPTTSCASPFPFVFIFPSQRLPPLTQLTSPTKPQRDTHSYTHTQIHTYIPGSTGRPVHRPLFLPILRVSSDSIFPYSLAPFPQSFSPLSSISPRAAAATVASTPPHQHQHTTSPSPNPRSLCLLSFLLSWQAATRPIYALFLDSFPSDYNFDRAGYR